MKQIIIYDDKNGIPRKKTFNSEKNALIFYEKAKIKFVNVEFKRRLNQKEGERRQNNK